MGKCNKDDYCDLSLVRMYLCPLIMPRRIVIRALEIMKKLDPRGAFLGRMMWDWEIDTVQVLTVQGFGEE